MHAIQDAMKDQHASCDEAFVALEAAVLREDWQRAKMDWMRFEDLLCHHMQVEENVLFPAIERETGLTSGPTQVMRMDHDQIRALLGPLGAALLDRDADESLGILQSMLLLIQQHNMKEEQVLYPMADAVLPDADSLVEVMRSRRATDSE